MRAIVKEKDGIFFREIPIPSIGPADVLIKVAIVAYCRTDGYVAQNKIKTKTPLVLGHEFSGVVENIGNKVVNFKKGDRVAIMPILPDANGKFLGPMFGVDRDGAFAEYVSVPEIAVHHIPDSMTFVQAAYLEPIAASAAILNVPLEKGQRGFLLGKNRIADLTRRILDLYGYGSLDLISVEEMKALPNDSYDFVIETIATTETMTELVRVIKPGGIIVLKSRQYLPVEINVKKIVEKELKLLGAQYGDFKKGIEMIVDKNLKIDDIFEVRDLEEACDIFKGDPRQHEDKKFFFNTHLCAE